MRRRFYFVLMFLVMGASRGVLGQCGNCTFPDQNANLYVLDPSGTHIVNLLTQQVFATLPVTAAAPPVLGRDGLMYGALVAPYTPPAGAPKNGAIFSVDSSGVVTIVHSFTGTDGYNPLGVTLGDDGNLYGITAGGGDSNYGTIFSYSPTTGTLTSLYSFSNTIDGRPIESELIQYDSEHFFGVSSKGLFSVTKAGAFVPITLSGDPPPLNITGLTLNGDFYTPDFYDISSTGVVTSLPSLADALSFYQCSSTSGPYLTYTGALYIAASCIDGEDLPFGILAAGNSNGNWTSLFSNDNVGAGCNGGLLIGYGLNGSIAAESICGSTVTGYASIYQTDGFTFTASPPTVNPGSPSTLSWGAVVDGFSGEECSAFGEWSGVKSWGGSTTVTLTEPGTHKYVLVCGGVAAAVATVTVAGATTTTLTATPNPLSPGHAVTLQAAVASSGQPVTNGTVKFNLAGAGSATVPVNSSGVATLTESSEGVPLGTYTVTAEFSGYGGFSTSKGSTVVNVVNASNTTTTFSLGNKLVCGDSNVSFQVQVATSGSYVPTGSVALKADSSTVVTIPLSDGAGSKTLSTNGLPAGTYQVTAVYSGDSLNTPSTSAPQQIALVPAAKVSLTASPNPVAANGTLTFTAAVTDGGQQGAGSVAFYYGSTLLGLATTQNGTATLQQDVSGVPAGTFPVTATYEGDTAQCKGTSAPVNVTVQ